MKNPERSRHHSHLVLQRLNERILFDGQLPGVKRQLTTIAVFRDAFSYNVYVRNGVCAT